MKKSESASKDNKNIEKSAKWRTAAICAIVAAVVLSVTLAIVLPIVKINADFDRIFENMEKINSPEVTVTDMAAENVFGNTKGEVTVSSADLVRELCALSENFKYDGRDTDSLGSWDIRFRVRGGGEVCEVYLDEEEMYYTVGGVNYRFEPKDEKTEKAYGSFLKTIKNLLDE